MKKLFTTLLLLVLSSNAMALRISNYYSPHNRLRAARPATKYIVLHTTEGARKGSLNKIHQRGEAHYFIDERGQVQRIIHRNRIATHAGRSMWNRTRNMDSHSIGIEVVGYHNGKITSAQKQAIKDLVAQLQKLYGITDKNVLCHAMVAYGAPNRWHRRSHRGRKRCGMLFAGTALRRELGLTDKHSYDPDVRAGRLTVGDDVLARVLYARDQTPAISVPQSGTHTISAKRSAWDIARGHYNSSTTTYIFPDGTKRKGNQITAWKSIPAGTKVIQGEERSSNEPEGFRLVSRNGTHAQTIAGSEYQSRTTVYFFPDNSVRQGDRASTSKLKGLPAGTRILVGYTYGGYVTRRRSAFDICGTKWNYPSTVYRLPDGTVKTGDMLSEGAIPRNTMLFFRN